MPKAALQIPEYKIPAQMIDVVAVADTDQPSPNGVTASGNDKAPENTFLPPLQQKQELLKKAVGVENVYDDGGPEHQHAEETADQDDMTANVMTLWIVSNG
jgi:hypothetical protein